nr:immunoglobulin light chain junction region [Macaca mulatta]MOV75052.1 immunoglobulin light chain junction region [Macaca mulatta]
CLQHNIYPYSF